MHATLPSSSSPDQCWVADTSATTHMTSDLSNLKLSTLFSGTKTVSTARGSGLPISSVRTSTLQTPQCSLHLTEVLHVPQMSQNLLSVYRLCKDNKCRFVCDALVFGFKTSSRGLFFSRGCVNLAYILFRFFILRLLLVQFLLSSTLILVILANKSEPTSGTSVWVIHLTKLSLHF